MNLNEQPSFGLKPYIKIGDNNYKGEKTEHEIESESVIFFGDPVTLENNTIIRRSDITKKIIGVFMGCMYYGDKPYFSKMYYGKNKKALAFIASDLDKLFLIRESGNLNKSSLWKYVNLTSAFGDHRSKTSLIELDSNSVSDEKLDVNLLGFYSSFGNDTTSKNSIWVVKINEK